MLVENKTREKINKIRGKNHHKDVAPKIKGIVNIEDPHAFLEFVRKIQLTIPKIKINKNENLNLFFEFRICAMHRGKIKVNQAPAYFA